MKKLMTIPFESATALFVIGNAILTLNSNSAVLAGLWNIVGFSAPSVPIIQMIAGLLTIIGIAKSASNIEACGLIMIMTMFIIRALVLVTDGDVTLSDWNNVIICFGITLASVVRIGQILRDIKVIHIERNDSGF